MHYKSTNNNKLNSRIINYFSEITAISEDCRKEYLRSLLKRKNAESQKNVRLLKIIYGLIKNSGIGRWDNDKICKALSMSMTALYFNKHKILKGLRALHFGWNEIEKECPRGENTELQKAEKMFEIGMRREAKTKFIKIEKALFNSYESTRAAAHSKDFISLSMVYTHLIEYYFNI